MSFGELVDDIELGPEDNAIYGLFDPRNDAYPRYVGKSFRPSERLDDHTSDSYLEDDTEKNIWLRGLKECGIEPEMRIFEIVKDSEVKLAEQQYIAFWRNLVGNWLTNGNGGGAGCWRPTEYTRSRMSQSHIGLTVPEEVKEKMSESRKRFLRDPENRKRLVEFLQGRGEDHNFVKYSDDTVLLVRDKAEAGEKLSGIARELNLNYQYVCDVVSGRCRRSVGGYITDHKPRQKFSATTVAEVLKLRSEGKTHRTISDITGVSKSRVGDIIAQAR